MKGLAITDKGLEDISLLEIKELLKVSGKVVDSGVVFDFKKIDDLYKLCYLGQSVFKVLNLIDNFSMKNDLIEELKSRVKKIDFSKYLGKGQTFAVRSWHKKIENSRGEIEGAVGSVIPGKVNLSDPDVVFFVYVYGSDVYFGIDVGGLDLSEREYKIFSHPNSLKGPVAYGLVRLGWNSKGKLVNYSCKSGEVGIEAALFGSGKAVNFYSKDKFEFDLEKFDKVKRKKKLDIWCVDSDDRSLSATKKNAKIAGVSQLVQVSKIKIEDLDVKFKEGEVSCLVGQVFRPEEVDKVKELFYQAAYILSGKLVICCYENENFDKLAEEHKFKKTEERMIERGGIKYKVLVFAK
ncbi:THUMP domain-containing protein [Nanoarchaeota archaeon]